MRDLSYFGTALVKIRQHKGMKKLKDAEGYASAHACKSGDSSLALLELTSDFHPQEDYAARSVRLQV